MNYTETVERARKEFGLLIRSMAVAAVDGADAAEVAKAARASDFTVTQLKTGVPAQLTDDVFSAGSPLRIMSEAFLRSLSHNGVLDRVCDDAVNLPMRTRLGVATSPLGAYLVDELKPAKPIVLSFTDLDVQLVPKKFQALLALTAELARVPGTSVLIERELRDATIAGTDKKFLLDMVAVNAPIASAGSSTANTQTDFDALLAAVSLFSMSKPLAVYSPAACKKLITKKTTSGDRAWPDMAWNGGEMSGVPVMVSDQLPSGAAVMLDCAQLGVNRGEFGVSIATQADIELQSAPSQDASTETGVQLTSLWQSDLVGIKSTRTAAYKVSRATAVASLSGVSY